MHQRLRFKNGFSEGEVSNTWGTPWASQRPGKVGRELWSGNGEDRSARQRRGQRAGRLGGCAEAGDDQASESIALHNERKDMSKRKKDYLVVQGIHDQGDQGHWKLGPSYTNLLQCVLFLDTTPTHQLDSYTPMHHAPQRLK